MRFLRYTINPNTGRARKGRTVRASGKKDDPVLTVPGGERDTTSLSVVHDKIGRGDEIVDAAIFVAMDHEGRVLVPISAKKDPQPGLGLLIDFTGDLGDFETEHGMGVDDFDGTAGSYIVQRPDDSRQCVALLGGKTLTNVCILEKSDCSAQLLVSWDGKGDPVFERKEHEFDDDE